tara:strand:+ start:930 stop:1502 length:573 start_codon:yes stop_codon:yes gene_type:complete
MATFPNIEPSYSVKKDQAPIGKVIRFADGYEHRIMFGIPNHQNPRQYSLSWENITEDEADTIDYFLNERAFDKASFDYAPPREAFAKTGTYTQSSTTITITIANHRLFTGESLLVDFTSGTGVDGTYIVSSITNANNFVITAASAATTNGDVSISKTGLSKFVCDKWTKTINVANLATIDATFREVFEPA